MNDEIRPPMPAKSPSGSPRESVSREQGRGSELTGTVTAQEGKLGIVVNTQFVPLTIALDAKVGDVVRARIEQAGKESSVRVLRILETTTSAVPAATFNPRTLRDLFPSPLTRPLQELYLSFQEVLDRSMTGEMAQLGGTLQQQPLLSPPSRSIPPPTAPDTSGVVLPRNGETPDSRLSGGPQITQSTAAPTDRNNSSPDFSQPFILTEDGLLLGSSESGPAANTALPSRYFQIPSAYGARSDELRTVSGAGASQPPMVPRALPPTPPAPTLARALLSSLSAALLEPTPSAGNPSSTREMIATFVEAAFDRIVPFSSNQELGREDVGALTSPLGTRTERQNPLKTTTQIRVETLQTDRFSEDIRGNGQVASSSGPSPALRFHQSATDAQPLLDQYNRLFESLNQPTYLLTSLVIGSHIMPFELSTFKDPPTVDRSSEEEQGAAPVRQGFSRVRMTIHLPTLGPVGMDVAYRESEVLLKFTTSSSPVTEFLSKELPLFSKELESEGFHLTSWFTNTAQPVAIAPGWFKDLVVGEIVA